MDADAARMMADLGLARRDHVSAPNADSKGRMVREDPRQQAAAIADMEKRRADRLDRATQQGDANAARVKAWNAASLINADDPASQLENRFSGQGHRFHLQRAHGHNQDDDKWAAIEAKYGEERASYLRAKEDKRSKENFAPNSSPKRDPRGGHSYTPCSFSGSHTSAHAFEERGRPVPARTSNHERAPSPRSFGTVRFGPGGARVNGGASAGPGAVTNTVTAAPPSAQKDYKTTPASVLSPVTPASTKAPMTPPPSAPAKIDPIREQVYINKALWYAANPGKECDTYHEQYPERKKYLGPAREHIIKEVTLLAKKGDAQDTMIYIETHRERTWMAEAAEKAKHQIENDSDADIQAYCAANPRQKHFLEAAKGMFTRRRDSAVANPVEPVKTSTALQPPPTPQVKVPATPAKHTVPTVVPSGNTVTNGHEGKSGGTLTVTFFDVKDKFKGIQQMAIAASARMKLTVTSLSESLDPCGLIAEIDAFAQSLASKNNTGLEGAKLAKDGVWEEEEEL